MGYFNESTQNVSIASSSFTYSYKQKIIQFRRPENMYIYYDVKIKCYVNI